MTWFLFTIISPVLNALVNYIDKYLVEKVVEGRGIGSLIIFSALIGLPLVLDMARRVQNISVGKNGEVEIVGDPLTVLYQLVKEYEILRQPLVAK